MTPKQQRFVQEYLIDLNATQAAIRAGYAHPTTQGPRLLENVGIKAAIQAEMDKRAQRREIDQDWVLECLEKVALRCLQEEAVRDADGKPIGEYKFEHAGANRALELIGKHLSMFKDVVEIRPGAEEMSDSDLAELARHAVSGRNGTAAKANGSKKPDSVH